MTPSIPTPAEVRATLEALSYSRCNELARLSGVPLTTLWNIRKGDTTNPGIETVGKFMPHALALIEAERTAQVPAQ
jgi:transcriptional regulator with XRE-family HTH domain